jgi:hypothetical protein
MKVLPSNRQRSLASLAQVPWFESEIQVESVRRIAVGVMGVPIKAVISGYGEEDEGSSSQVFRKILHRLDQIHESILAIVQIQHGTK